MNDILTLILFVLILINVCAGFIIGTTIEMHKTGFSFVNPKVIYKEK